MNYSNPYDEILFSNKNEQTIDTHYSYGWISKVRLKRLHYLWFHFYDIRERENYIEKEFRCKAAAWKSFFIVVELVQYLFWGVGTKLYVFVKSHNTLHPNCEFYYMKIKNTIKITLNCTSKKSFLLLLFFYTSIQLTFRRVSYTISYFIILSLYMTLFVKIYISFVYR